MMVYTRSVLDRIAESDGAAAAAMAIRVVDVSVGHDRQFGVAVSAILHEKGVVLVSQNEEYDLTKTTAASIRLREEIAAIAAAAFERGFRLRGEMPDLNPRIVAPSTAKADGDAHG